jgi:hypothetical protein
MCIRRCKYIESDKKILDILRYCPYEIWNRFKHQTYLQGQIIFNQGEVYDYCCIIVTGMADIYITVENGRKYSQAIYGKGDFIGELIEVPLCVMWKL